MDYLEIAVKTTTFGSELVADILEEITGDGVNITDKNDLNVPTWDYEEDGFQDSYPEDVIVRGYLKLSEKEQKLPEILARLEHLKKSLSDIGSLNLEFRLVNDSDWRTEWKKYYAPIPVGKLRICPEWIKTPTPEGTTDLLLDPGLAFGTGEHETTRLALQLMQNVPVKGKSVLDVGCGSGILGIGAAALGAKDVVGIDNDPQAVEAAHRNVALNAYAMCCQIRAGDLLKEAKGTFDLILANLTADLLLLLSEDICRFVHDGSYVILSGILKTKKELVKARYEQLGFCQSEESAEGEWVALTYRYCE